MDESFWNNVYNVGGGKSCRLTAYEFMDKMFNTLGVSIQDVYEPNMFALRNFHGQYYLDSDHLDDILHFRSEGVDEVIDEIKAQLPFHMKFIKYLPKRLIKFFLALESQYNLITPLYWIKHRKRDRIKAFFGSKENWKRIGGWGQFEHIVDPPHIMLNHGYDEDKDSGILDIEDMKEAANFRGGQCLSTEMVQGDLNTKLRWVCSEGHQFMASPYLVLKTGHWCGKCVHAPWDFDAQAKKSPFIAQVWHADHDAGEDNIFR
jgi:hypothetical protein